MMSIADELAKLAKPIEQGVISESEFQQMKQDLISREESTSTIAIVIIRLTWKDLKRVLTNKNIENILLSHIPNRYVHVSAACKSLLLSSSWSNQVIGR